MARRSVLASVIVALLLARATPATADASFSARYVGESAFVAAVPGSTARFVAIFLNDGYRTWEPGVVGLLACDPDGSACGTSSANADYAVDWYATGVYATVAAPVPPGGLSFFSYGITIPHGTAPGTSARFRGAVGLIAGGVAFGGDGYYQDARVPDPGIAARLTVSGNDSPRAAGQRVSISVDVDDVNVELVSRDSTTVITASLDPATCAGAGGGPAYLESAARTAEAGRAWFTIVSLGAYTGCRLSVSAPGLVSATTTITFEPGPAAALRCDFTPSAIANEPSAQAIATIEVIDRYGNPSRAADGGALSIVRTSGDATAVVSAPTVFVLDQVPHLVVRSELPGADVYAVSFVPGTSSVQPTTALCGVLVSDHL